MTENAESGRVETSGDAHSDRCVLHADANESILNGVAEAVEMHLGEDLVSGVTEPNEAVVMAEARSWSCLILGDGFDPSVRSTVLDAVDCPTVAFTADPASIPDALLAHVDTVIEKRDDVQRPVFLAGTVGMLLESRSDPERTNGSGYRSGDSPEVTVRQRRLRELVAERDELLQIDRTNVLLQEIVSALNGVASKDEIQRIVCDRLVESDRYGLAVIGEHRGTTDRIVPITWAGPSSGYVEDLEVRTDDTRAGRGPGGRAYRTGEVQVIEDVRIADQFAPWRDRALEYGLESIIAVPLEHRGATHGILGVYATEPDAFGDRLTASFAVLGEITGLALTAVQNKRLVRQDDTMELEFRSTSSEACLVWLARACNCTIECEDAVHSDDGVVQYLRVGGALPESVVDAVRERDVDYDVRITRSNGNSGGVVELHAPTSLPVDLSDVGARLDEFVTKPDGIRAVVEAPIDADVRGIHDVIEQTNPDTELVSKTRRDDRSTTRYPPDPSSQVLTDRQEEILSAAYLAGYYALPRDTTAEELADSLGIASSTLHQHLRRAERKVIQQLFEE